MRQFSNLANVILARTYARQKPNFRLETWPDVVERVVSGNVRNFNVSEQEINRLKYFMTERKAGPAGRGLWMSGSPTHAKIGGAGLVNCWAYTLDEWMNFVYAMDLLMLGGGVGFSVESRYVYKLPRVKKDVVITHKLSKDADWIVPDSREGWVETLRRVLESWFVTGRSFTYSTICVRGPGEAIGGFGGISSGPRPLIRAIEKICAIFCSRQGKQLHPIQAVDIAAAVGELVVSGNIRRSAIIFLGDAGDKEYLKAKRFDLGPVPTQRAMANFSVVADHAEDELGKLFWDTYKHGEPFGIVNRKNIRKYGRMGEEKEDTALLCNPCAEATLPSGSCCNLQNINLAAIDNVEEFREAARLFHRYGKRVACEKYHNEYSNKIIHEENRVGTSITGCLQNPILFNPEVLDIVYDDIQDENVKYSNELGIAPSIRTTTVNPGGTVSKLYDAVCEGIHPAYSRHIIQRVRIASNDPLIPKLKAAGHYMEPVERFDGTLDSDTYVVDFYVKAPDGAPCADEGFDTWKQLEALQMAQKHWADQSCSVTVYYNDEDLGKVKEWVTNNLDSIKTISFLKHSGHKFKQAPKQPITKEQYEKLSAKIKPIDTEEVGLGEIEGLGCEGGACPIR